MASDRQRIRQPRIVQLAVFPRVVPQKGPPHRTLHQHPLVAVVESRDPEVFLSVEVQLKESVVVCPRGQRQIAPADNKSSGRLGIKFTSRSIRDQGCQKGL